MKNQLRQRRRNLIVLSILLVFPVYSNIHQFTLQRRAFRAASGPYELPRLTQEAKGFQSYLSNQNTTGFFSELPQADIWNGVQFAKLQYAIAPDILKSFEETHYAVAQFHDPNSIAEFLQREHFRVIKTYPDGVTLLESTK